VSRVVDVDPFRPQDAEAAVAEAARALREGELVVLPTETVYGVACRPDDPAATARLFEAKARPPGLNLAVLASTAGEALALTRPTPHAMLLAGALWPGPLTMVLERTSRTREWSLGEHGDTVGVRVPDLPIALALLARTGPLAVTSANRSGELPAATREELVAAFGDAVTFYLTVAGAPGSGDPSTVIDLTDPPRLRLLRSGAYTRERIAACVADSVPGPEWVDFPA
jgi:tRNA threonylcarbamoyl adenosine modification protein (Sua5/YciO/YrdC/YwlC family)